MVPRKVPRRGLGVRLDDPQSDTEARPSGRVEGLRGGAVSPRPPRAVRSRVGAYHTRHRDGGVVGCVTCVGEYTLLGTVELADSVLGMVESSQVSDSWV